MKAIILNLRGPLRSWGAMSIGDDRWTNERPTASAVIGLLGACAGIDRHNRALCAQWHMSWRMASLRALEWSRDRSNFTPTVRTDFQTARDSFDVSGKTKDDAVVSRRGYIEEAREVCALVFADNAQAELLELALRGLKNPVYTPCLGRRSNPLSQPLAGRDPVIEFGDAAELVDAMMLTLRQPGLMEYGPIKTDFVEVCGDAGFFDSWRAKQKDQQASIRLVRQSEMDERMGGVRKHTSRAIDVISWDLAQAQAQAQAT